MTVDGFRSLGRRRIASASFLDLERIHLATPDGGRIERVVVTHPGAVAVLPIIEDQIVFIRQYRPAIDKAVLEIPAGKLDVPGEPPEATAHRELEEEMGYRAGTMRPLVTFYTTPGFCDEVMFVFVAEELTEVVAAPHGAEEEVAEVVRVPIDDARDMLADGDIEDAKTIIALGLYLLER